MLKTAARAGQTAARCSKHKQFDKDSSSGPKNLIDKKERLV
jgi:hypothetical protein